LKVKDGARTVVRTKAGHAFISQGVSNSGIDGHEMSNNNRIGADFQKRF
jgi:hypothetical protein